MWFIVDAIIYVLQLPEMGGRERERIAGQREREMPEQNEMFCRSTDVPYKLWEQAVASGFMGSANFLFLKNFGNFVKLLEILCVQ